MNGSRLVSCWIFYILLSCNNIPDCDDPNTSDLVIHFMDSTNSALQIEIFNAIQDLETGFKFVENDTTSMVTLEINPTQSTTGYVFEGDGLIDTLIVGYEQNLLLLSEECGPVIKFSELTILKQTFSDTLVVNDELLRNEVNIQIIR